LLGGGDALAKSVITSVEPAAGVAAGDGLVITAGLGAQGVGIDVVNVAVEWVVDCTTTLGGNVDDVVVAAGVEGRVVGLAIATLCVGQVVDFVLATTGDGGIVGHSVAAPSQRSSSFDQVAVSTAGLLCCVVAFPLVLSNLTAGFVSAIDEMTRTASLVGWLVDLVNTATL